MASLIRSSLVPILKAIQTQLVTVTKLPKDRVVLVSDWPDPHFPVGTQDLLIRPLGFMVHEPGGPEGAGRLETILHRRLGILVRTQLATDLSEQSYYWFTDSTLGHLQLEEAVMDALQNFVPTDASGNWLTSAPMKLVGGEIPEKHAGWEGAGYELLLFDFIYLPPMTISLDRARL